MRTADEEGVLAGMYTAIKHAESFGEPLPLDEIDTEVERTILTMKRGQVVRSQQSTAKGTFKKIYDEIMARPRPLG